MAVMNPIPDLISVNVLKVCFNNFKNILKVYNTNILGSLRSLIHEKHPLLIFKYLLKVSYIVSFLLTKNMPDIVLALLF